MTRPVRAGLALAGSLCGVLSGVLCGLLVVGCAGTGVGRESVPASEGRASSRPYHPDRRDYGAFREAWPEVLEPNYLPFMVHRFEGDAARGDVLVFCRWPDVALPLRVFIETPTIDPAVQDEFRPVDPALLVEAVAAALIEWERHLDGVVRFERVATAEDARLRIMLHGREAPVPVPGRRVLGQTEALAHACLSRGWDPERDALLTRFDVPTLDLHLADEYGLLGPDTVRRLAMHELGHALGMRGHSPSPGDLMHARLDRASPRSGLSDQDVHSFLSLYSMPPGTVYGEVPVGPPTPRLPAAPPSGAPQLALAPWVDARFGFEIRLPSGWLRIEESHGVLATHGPSWDHDASLRVLVWPAADIQAFLDRYQADLMKGTWFRARRQMVVLGRPAVEIEVEDPAGVYVQRFRFVELPEERVMLLLSESPIEHDEAWRPWFDVVLETLEVWTGNERLGENEATH